jgi:hypothetical protein
MLDTWHLLCYRVVAIPDGSARSWEAGCSSDSRL